MMKYQFSAAAARGLHVGSMVLNDIQQGRTTNGFGDLSV